MASGFEKRNSDERRTKRKREEWVRRGDALEEVKDRMVGSLVKKCTEQISFTDIGR